MKSLAIVPVLFVAVSATYAQENAMRYDFRTSPAFQALSDADRAKLETVHRDFTLLWGALDRYADHHGGNAPASLDDLVPLYIRELPKDPFATTTSAAEKEIQFYLPSLDGFGYRYRQGRGRSWITTSVGLPEFPYLAERGNVGLYMPKGTWISGMQRAGVSE